MVIHFVHAGNAYLPELQAYVEYINLTGNHARVHLHVDTVPQDAAVVWWMCGLVSPKEQSRIATAFHIHEYASASVGRLASFKDICKRWIQPKPNYRIFQNGWVRARLAFNDSLPFEYRDMGIPATFFKDCHFPEEKEFDFVYVGEMRRLHYFRPLFDALAYSQMKVLLVGQLPRALEDYFNKFNNVTAVGKVPQSEVPHYLDRAKYGLNLVPNLKPYTEQTSTKLLEYCAANLKVMSTEYPWVRRFEQQYGACFYYIPFRHSARGYSHVISSALREATFRTPNLQSLAWPNLLSRLEIWRELGI